MFGAKHPDMDEAHLLTRVFYLRKCVLAIAIKMIQWLMEKSFFGMTPGSISS